MIRSRSFFMMYIYQIGSLGCCAVLVLAPLMQISNKLPMTYWWGFPLALVLFVISSRTITFLREKDLYAYAIWGILRDKIEYKDINHLEVIAARHFLFTGNFDVVIRTSTKSSPSVTISFSEYVNWREMVEFLIERLRSENPNFIFDPRLIEKLK